ncbi:hypothetical protein ACVJF1_005045 [Bradyrhizobium diazoefficiens]
MQPIDFRYRLSDRGRIVLGQLSTEETVEFELLTRRDREGLMDLPSELRLLELYVKYVGARALKPHSRRRNPPGATSRRYDRRDRRPRGRRGRVTTSFR